MIKIIAFLVSFVPFLLWLRGAGRRRYTVPDTETEPAPIVDNTPEPGQGSYFRECLPGSGDFYRERIRELYTDLTSARNDEDRARGRVEHMENVNQYGAVISQKNIDRERRELYAAQHRRRAIENDIMKTEKALERAGA